jgi:luciferase-like monooxygenase
MTNILDSIQKEILSWPFVTAEAHKFGGIEFRLNKREMGHIHGERLVDLPFPMTIRNKLVSSGRVSPHHVLPQSGWVSYWINNGEKDVPEVLELFRMRYEQLKPRSQPKREEDCKMSNVIINK